MLIKEMYQSIRPRERAMMQGVSVLSDAELLALVLSSGTNKMSAVELGNEILRRFTLTELKTISVRELTTIKGIGQAKALKLVACFELLNRANEIRTQRMTTPKEVYDHVKSKLIHKKQEHVYVLLFDSAKMLVFEQVLFIGTITNSMIHPRELIALAYKHHATSLVMVHNHPSGDPTPSEADITLTKQLVKHLTFMGIVLTDHLVIGSLGYTSMKEMGVL